LIIIIIISIFIILFKNKNKDLTVKLKKNTEIIDKLLMRNDLKPINFKQIKFDKVKDKLKVIGIGASSVVYSGYYDSKRVAIKKIKYF
jgi:hypothetical protein